ELSLAFVDSLARHRGGLLNVGSMAGFLPGPGMAVYYASKAYVLSFTEALSREVKPLGVKVTALCPGPVKTEFQLRAGIDASSPSRLLGRTAQEVAEAGYDGFMAGKRLVIPGIGNKIVSVLARLAPRGLVLDAVGSYQDKRGRREGWQRRPK